MKSLYPNGHDVYSNDLQFSEEAREFEDRQRTLAVCGDEYGVVSGFEVTDASTTSNKFEVSAGLAIDEFGYRVNLASGVTVSGITTDDIGSYVVACVDNSDTLPTEHRVTGDSAYTREVDGALVTIVSSVPSGSGYVKLACISNVTPGPAADIEFSDTIISCREVFRIDPNRLGTGTSAKEHRLSAHSNGISSPGCSALTPSVFNAATDYIEFTSLVDDDYISVNGSLLSAEDVNPPADVLFDTGTDAAGSWNIYVDDSGNTGKTQAALVDSQLLIATVDFDDVSGDLDNLSDERVFYETTQDNIRVDLTEAETNDSLTECSTLKNNLNKIRYRIHTLETTGKAYTVVANSGGDYNGDTDAIFITAINAMPASGGTIIVADGEWDFENTVNINKSISFVSHKNSNINMIGADPFTAFEVQSDNVVFDGLVFNGSSSLASGVGGVGAEFWGISSENNSNLDVGNCEIYITSAAGDLAYGALLKVGGGHTINVINNYLEFDQSALGTHTNIVKVVDPVGNNTLSGLNILNNFTYSSNASADLFWLEDNAAINTINIQGNNSYISNSRTNLFGWVLSSDSWIYAGTGTAMYNANINNNCVKGDVYSGVTLRGNSMNGTISNNTFNLVGGNKDHYIIHVDGGFDWVISNNAIRTGKAGIYIGVDTCAINGNCLTEIEEHGILVEGHSNVISNNIVFDDAAGSATNVGIDIQGNSNIVDGNRVKFNNDAINDGGGGNFVNESVDNTTNLIV